MASPVSGRSTATATILSAPRRVGEIRARHGEQRPVRCTADHVGSSVTSSAATAAGRHVDRRRRARHVRRRLAGGRGRRRACRCTSPPPDGRRCASASPPATSRGTTTSAPACRSSRPRGCRRRPATARSWSATSCACSPATGSASACEPARTAAARRRPRADRGLRRRVGAGGRSPTVGRPSPPPLPLAWRPPPSHALVGPLGRAGRAGAGVGRWPRTGAGQIVLLGGEAGTGKTRLATEFGRARPPGRRRRAARDAATTTSPSRTSRGSRRSTSCSRRCSTRHRRRRPGRSAGPAGPAGSSTVDRARARSRPAATADPGGGALPAVRGVRRRPRASGRPLADRRRARRPALGRGADARPAAPRRPIRAARAAARRRHVPRHGRRADRAARRLPRRPAPRRRGRHGCASTRLDGAAVERFVTEAVGHPLDAHLTGPGRRARAPAAAATPSSSASCGATSSRTRAVVAARATAGRCTTPAATTTVPDSVREVVGARLARLSPGGPPDDRGRRRRRAARRPRRAGPRPRRRPRRARRPARRAGVGRPARRHRRHRARLPVRALARARDGRGAPCRRRARRRAHLAVAEALEEVHAADRRPVLAELARHLVGRGADRADRQGRVLRPPGRGPGGPLGGVRRGGLAPRAPPSPSGRRTAAAGPRRSSTWRPRRCAMGRVHRRAASTAARRSRWPPTLGASRASRPRRRCCSSWRRTSPGSPVGRRSSCCGEAIALTGDGTAPLQVRLQASLGRALAIEGRNDEAAALIAVAVARAREIGDAEALLVGLQAVVTSSDDPTTVLDGRATSSRRWRSAREDPVVASPTAACNQCRAEIARRRPRRCRPVARSAAAGAPRPVASRCSS